MKRSLSESETDDIYSGDEKDGEEGTGGLSRKRRRGIIEKRRRDRINNSLAELRRLVPAAFEKQGSAKLEKAEILQMAVDHLKMLHNKGLDSMGYDPNKYAMDYHNVGFRECAAEVARYMVTVEGMDIQDPLRLRLMSHLQCYSAQREIANKQAASTWSWGSSPPVPSPSSVTYHSNPSIAGYQGHMLSHHPSTHPNPTLSSHTPSLSLEQSHGISAFTPPNSSSADIATSSCSVMGSMPHQAPRILSSVGSHHPPPAPVSVPNASSHPHTNYHLNLNAQAFPVNQPNITQTTNIQANLSLSSNLSLTPNSSLANHSYPSSLQGSSGMKPYRPWGAEIAY